MLLSWEDRGAEAVLLSWEDRGAEAWSWNLDGGPFRHDRELVIRRTVHAAAGHDPGAA